MIDTDKIKPRIKELAEKYGLSLMMLFGSQVTGKTHKDSDFDIAYLSDKKLSFEDEGRMIIDLVPIIGARDERLVNLSDIRKAGALLLKEIFDKHQVLFCADRNIYDSYKIFAVKNFIESRQLFDLRDYLIKRYFISHAQ
ncbi:MAG: nucleotidyltransferase domain-containing protein [Patescibacteria group bacterium]|nr:nucleotidyltransferase domain-containing protein [Patescibacteria group bacterium]MDE1988250.1 nucleotidyltransferase domain-containing protein [Patescibacteria group bacterium]MDE2218287.1 nucleotidyltransferase domain-containing protein [Patescibacteria group bacterium]